MHFIIDVLSDYHLYYNSYFQPHYYRRRHLHLTRKARQARIVAETDALNSFFFLSNVSQMLQYPSYPRMQEDQ